MLRLIKYELIKLFSQKNMKSIFVLLLLISTLFVYIESTDFNQASKNHSVYSAIKNEMDTMELKDKCTYLKSKTAFLERVTAYEDTINRDVVIQEDTDVYDPQFISEYEQFLQTEEYENKQVYSVLYDDLLQYYVGILEYDQYIEQVIVNAENYQKGIFWLQADDVKKTDILQASNQYAQLKELSLTETNTLSIDIFNHVLSPYLIMLMVGILLAILVFKEDEDTEIGQLQLISLQGKYKTATAKLIVITMMIAIISLIVNMLTLLLLQILYGFVDGGLAIQSISTLYESPYNLSILQYLTYTIALKTVFLITIIIMFCGIHKVFKKATLSIALTIIIFVVSGFMFLTISETQTVGLLKYLNFYSFLCSNHFFSKFINGLAHYQLNIVSVSLIISLIVMILFVALYFISYVKRKQSLHQFRMMRLHLYIKSTNLFIQELFKTMWINKAILFIILFMVIQSFYLLNSYQSVPDYLKSNEQQLAQAIKKFDGALSDKEKALIESKHQRYEEDKINLDIQYQNYLKGEIGQEKYNEFVYEYVSDSEERMLFNWVYEKYSVSNDYLTYSTGFRAVFSTNTYSREIRCAVLLILSIIFLTYSIINSDLQNDENCLYRITYNGRKKRANRRLCMIVISGIVLVLLYSFIELFVFDQLYPMDDWQAPLSSVITGEDQIVLQFPFYESMPIWQYYLQFLFIRIFAIFTCGMIGIWISKICNSKTHAFVVALAIFLLPLLLYLGGLEFILHISLFDMVMGNLFIHTQFVVLKMLIFAVIDVLIIRHLTKEKSI